MLLLLALVPAAAPEVPLVELVLEPVEVLVPVGLPDGAADEEPEPILALVSVN
jgi:hypothetical protein